MRRSARNLLRTLGAFVLLACSDGVEDTGGSIPRGDMPTVTPPEPRIKRLTESQYRNSIADIFSPDIAVTTQIDPLEESDGSYAIGAGVSTISPLGIERFETAAYQVAAQAMADIDVRNHWVRCEPEAIRDDDCAAESLTALGLRVWRRPLDAEEVAGLVEIAGHAATVTSDFYLGFEYAIAALLQSPYFLYRIEIGEEDAEGYRYSDYEMASRLSYYLWNTTPDAELLQAAEYGELTTMAGLETQVDRLLDDARSRNGMRAFFTDMLDLHELDDLTKDPLISNYNNPYITIYLYICI